MFQTTNQIMMAPTKCLVLKKNSWCGAFNGTEWFFSGGRHGSIAVTIPPLRFRHQEESFNRREITTSSIDPTWWFIPLSKWVITLVINGISGVSPLITRVITHLRFCGMNHQAYSSPFLWAPWFEAIDVSNPSETRETCFCRWNQKKKITIFSGSSELKPMKSFLFVGQIPLVTSFLRQKLQTHHKVT